MADQPQAPTQEQLDAVKAENDAQMAKWEGDFSEEQLTVPYKKDDAAANSSADEDSDKSDTSSASDSESDEDNEDEESEEQVTETFEEPKSLVTVADPGEFTPGDYSFDVTLADGKKVTISTPTEAEKLADDPDNFETPKQLMDFINKQNKMVQSLDRDKEKWETQKTRYDEQVAQEEQRAETVNSFVKEFNYLVSKDLLPEVAAKYRNADWQDPEIASQPGVKEQTAVLNYMVKENQARAKAGVPVLTSVIDAFNAMQADPKNQAVKEKQLEEKAEKKVAGQARKAAGARVAGASASQQGSYVPKGIAVGNPNVLRRGASIWDD